MYYCTKEYMIIEYNICNVKDMFYKIYFTLVFKILHFTTRKVMNYFPSSAIFVFFYHGKGLNYAISL